MMCVLTVLLLCGIAYGQVSQGCFLQPQPSIVLTSALMDPVLCQQNCPSSLYILMAPTLNDESSFWCSCANSIPSETSTACKRPCPGSPSSLTAPLCGGYRFSHTSIAWSVYASDMAPQAEQQLPAKAPEDPTSIIFQSQPSLGTTQIQTSTSINGIATPESSSGLASQLDFATTTIPMGSTPHSTVTSSTSTTYEPGLPLSSPPFSPTFVVTEAFKASNTEQPDQKAVTSLTPHILIISLSVLILIMLLAAFAWWYLLRSSTSMKDSNHFNGSEGADEEKVLRYVPYTGPVIPTKRERLRIRETVVSLDLSYLSTGK